MVCPKCKVGQLDRVRRQGFLENRILARLGYFPWECATCRKRSFIRTRGWRKADSSTAKTA
jgi:hypothetical protein